MFPGSKKGQQTMPRDVWGMQWQLVEGGDCFTLHCTAAASPWVLCGVLDTQRIKTSDY